MKDEVVFWFGLQASDVIAISAACIALISGVIALWQGWLMRRHNILSVTPHIDIATSLIPRKAHKHGHVKSWSRTRNHR